MSKTNHARVGEALDILNNGLRPFVDGRTSRRFQRYIGTKRYPPFCAKTVGRSNPRPGARLIRDTQNLLLIMWETWSGVFRTNTFWDIRSGPSSANCAKSRNRWKRRLPLAATTPTAPPGQHRALAHRLVSAPEAKERKEEQKMALLRVRFDANNGVANCVNRPWPY